MSYFESTLSGLDYAIIGLYVVMILGLGVWSKLGKKQDAEEYLIARHSMNWIVVSIAVFATLFSTISFVSAPGEAYNFGLINLLGSLGYGLFLPLAIWLFLRFFFNAPTFTAYEYLERRFDRRCRVISAFLFITIRLFYTAGVFYAAAVIFESIVGWPPVFTICVTGIVTIIYAYMGGVRAVMLADVVQSVIIVGGIVAILFRLLQVTDFNLGAVFSFAHENNRTFELLGDPGFYRLNVHDRWNFWLLFLGIALAPMTSMSCDQMVIQRLLAGKNYKQAIKSSYTNYFISIPVSVMLYTIGLILFYYYNQGALRLPAGLSGDHALGHFIKTELPAPIPGIIVTALLSALMSTVAGAVNSLVTVVIKDMVALVKPELVGTEREMSLCKKLTIAGGLAAIAVAVMMYVSGTNVKTTVLEVVGVWMSLWPILFSIFLYGVASKRVSAKAIFVSLCISGSVGLIFPYVSYYLLPEGMRWGMSWVGMPGLILSLALPPLFGLIWPNQKDLTGLTVYTTGSFIKDNR